MMAAVQRRTGPYNVGYFGLLQPMDDGLKLVKNEVIIKVRVALRYTGKDNHGNFKFIPNILSLLG